MVVTHGQRDGRRNSPFHNIDNAMQKLTISTVLTQVFCVLMLLTVQLHRKTD